MVKPAVTAARRGSRIDGNQASNSWDVAGGALLIDPRRVGQNTGSRTCFGTIRTHILGSLSDMGMFETADGVLPDPGPIELGRRRQERESTMTVAPQIIGRTLALIV